jgi:O-acetyl-ADP-ribose deacetylase (regulator of RNase III)
VIYYRSGNLLESNAQTLVNTVNCVGVMGKGLALDFKRKFPEMYRDYVAMCNSGLVSPGVPYSYSIGKRQVINFPTKAHWKAKSRLADIERGLRILSQCLGDWNVTSMALPPLGCGNGGLEWRDVRPLIEKYLGGAQIDIDVYLPVGYEQDATERPDVPSKPLQEHFQFEQVN